MEAGAQLFAERFAAGRAGFEGDLDDGLVGSAGEEVDQVHGVAGGYDADEIAGDLDVLRADLAVDDVEGAQHLALGLFDARAGGGAQADAQNGRFDIGEDFGADARQEDYEQGGGSGEIEEYERPAEMQDGGEVAIVEPAQEAEEAFALFAAMAFFHQPRGEDGHQAAGEQVGRDHGERYGERERHEELAADADHEERRYEDGQNAEHGEQARHGGAAARFDDGAGSRDAGQHLGVNVFDFDGGLVHQDADGEGQSAERHDVDGLAGGPEEDHGAQQGERDVEDDDQGAAPVAQEDEDHQAGERGSEQALEDQAADGVANVGRLVEFQADIDVVGYGFFEIGDGGFDGVDHREGGSVGALGDGDVDGAAAVDVGVGGDQVGAVFDGADVAQVDGGARVRADGRAREVPAGCRRARRWCARCG